LSNPGDAPKSEGIKHTQMEKDLTKLGLPRGGGKEKAERQTDNP